MAPQVNSAEIRDVVAGAPLQRVVPVTKSDLLAISNAAYEFLNQGQWEKARNGFHALTQLSPNLSVGYAGLGAVALAQGKLQEAVAPLGKAIQLKSIDPRVYAEFGEVMLRLGQPEQAIPALRAATELNPGQPHPSAGRARAMLAAIEEAKKPS